MPKFTIKISGPKGSIQRTGVFKNKKSIVSTARKVFGDVKVTFIKRKRRK